MGSHQEGDAIGLANCPGRQQLGRLRLDSGREQFIYESFRRLGKFAQPVEYRATGDGIRGGTGGGIQECYRRFFRRLFASARNVDQHNAL